MKQHDIIQIAPPHKWGGCLAVVDEVKSFGCQAYVSIPSNDGSAPMRAYIRLNGAEYWEIGAQVAFMPAEDQP